MFAQMASITLTVCVSLDQFYCIYRGRAKMRLPASNRRKVMQRECAHALMVVLGVFVFSFLYCVPYWLMFKYDKENGLHHTSLGEDPSFKQIVQFWMYMPIAYIIPFTILIITNIYLIGVLVAAKKRRQRLNQKSSNKAVTQTLLISFLNNCQSRD